MGSGLFGLIGALIGNYTQARRAEHEQRMDYEAKQMSDLELIAFPERAGLPADAFPQDMQTRARDNWYKLLNKGLGSKETKAQAAEIQNLTNAAAPMRAAAAQANRAQGGDGHLPDSPKKQLEAAKTAAAQGTAPLSTLAPGAGAQPPAARTTMPGTSLPTLAGQPQPGTIPAVSPRIAPPQPYAQMAYTQPTGPPGATPQSAAMPVMPQSTVAIGAQPAPFGAKPTGSMPAPTGAVPIRQGAPPAILSAPPAVPGAAQAPTISPSVAVNGKPTAAPPLYTPPLAVAGKEPRGGPLGFLRNLGQGIEQSFTGQPRDVLKGYPTPPPVESLGLTPDEAAKQRYKLALSLGMQPEEAQYYALGGKPATPPKPTAAKEGTPFQQELDALKVGWRKTHDNKDPEGEDAARLVVEAHSRLEKQTGVSLPADLKERNWVKDVLAHPNQHTPEEVSTAKERQALYEAQDSLKINEAVAKKRQVEGRDIKPGSDAWIIAQQLAFGDITFDEWKSMYSSRADLADKREAMYALAKRMNPNFSPALFAQNFKFSENVQTKNKIASLNNVAYGLPDLLEASDAAQRAGFTKVNEFVNQFGFDVGNQSYTNFKEAVTAYADELAGALGYGTNVTDMSREMGFDMTNPNLSPANFRSGMQKYVFPFIERKKQNLLDQMGPYAKPEEERNKDIQRKVGLNAEGLPAPSYQGAKPQPDKARELLKLYLAKYGDKAEEELMKAGWADPKTWQVAK